MGFVEIFSIADVDEQNAFLEIIGGEYKVDSKGLYQVLLSTFLSVAYILLQNIIQCKF